MDLSIYIQNTMGLYILKENFKGDKICYEASNIKAKFSI